VNDSFYPEYDYPQTVCSYYPCPVSTPVIRGYRVSRSFSVKIRNVDDVSSVSEGLGLLALSNMSGPNFVVDNDESVKSEARTMAIKNAKEKAKQISKDLDIKLKRIVSFYEEEPSGGFMPYMSKAMDVSVASGEEFSSGTPILPTGENKYTSKITVVYEVR
jgi:uncharacterized protein YggE